MSALDRLIPGPVARPLSQPLNLRPVLIGALCVIGVVGLFQVMQTGDATTTGYSLRSLDQERLALQAEVHGLEAEVAALTSIERIEREARGRLGMAPPEHVLSLEVQMDPPTHQLVPERYLTEVEEPTPDGGSWREALLRLLPFY